MICSLFYTALTYFLGGAGFFYDEEKLSSVGLLIATTCFQFGIIKSELTVINNDVCREQRANMKDGNNPICPSSYTQLEDIEREKIEFISCDSNQVIFDIFIVNSQSSLAF
jgi:hypothetical protein